MTEERYRQLMWEDIGELAPEEVAAGWHWCQAFDGLLVGPGMHEQKACTCFVAERPKET